MLDHCIFFSSYAFISWSNIPLASIILEYIYFTSSAPLLPQCWHCSIWHHPSLPAGSLLHSPRNKLPSSKDPWSHRIPLPTFSESSNLNKTFVYLSLKNTLSIIFWSNFALQTLQYPFANSKVSSALHSAERGYEVLITLKSAAEFQIGLGKWAGTSCYPKLIAEIGPCQNLLSPAGGRCGLLDFEYLGESSERRSASNS